MIQIAGEAEAEEGEVDGGAGSLACTCIRFPSPYF